MKKCPNCGLLHDNNVEICDCGQSLAAVGGISKGGGISVVGSTETYNHSTSYSPSQVSDEITYSPARVNNYTTIKTVAKLFQGGAILAGLLAIWSLFNAIGAYEPRYGYSVELFIFGFFFAAGAATALVFAFLSESINVFLDVEANSRQTAKTLERILRSQGSD